MSLSEERKEKFTKNEEKLNIHKRKKNNGYFIKEDNKIEDIERNEPSKPSKVHDEKGGKAQLHDPIKGVIPKTTTRVPTPPTFTPPQGVGKIEPISVSLRSKLEERRVEERMKRNSPESHIKPVRPLTQQKIMVVKPDGNPPKIIDVKPIVTTQATRFSRSEGEKDENKIIPHKIIPRKVSTNITIIKPEVYTKPKEHAVQEIQSKDKPEENEVKVPDVFELFLEEKSGRSIYEALKYSEEPVYIVLSKPQNTDYKCIDTLHYFCIRELREYLGILPETRLLSSEYGRTEVERYWEKEITIIDEKTLSKMEVGSVSHQAELLLKELNEEALADRIKDIGKGLHYVIFHVKQHLAEFLYNKLWKLKSTFYDKIFWIEPKDLSVNLRKKLAELMWAFVDIPNTGSYDELLGAGKTAYYNKLESLGEEVGLTPARERPYPIVRTHRLGSESKDHLLLKKFLAKCLVDKPLQELKISTIKREERHKQIEFEKEWSLENQLIAVSDAYIKSDEVAIEIETLFEEGKHGGEPIAKIRDETVNKYCQFEIQIRELWIVLENITMLRHLKKLWELHDYYEREYEEGRINFKVRFFALNIKDETLLQIEELVQHVIKFES